MSNIDDDIEIMLEYAKSFLLIPYLWGGNSPFGGYDCSGFVQAVLASIGKDPQGDQTAMGMFNALRIYTREDVLREGSILYFGKNKAEISHIAIALNPRLMIEAGGGNSKTLTIDDAKKQNAFIRVRPIRHDLVAYQNLY